MQISDEMVEAFGNAFWSVNAASKIDGQRDHIRSALEAALSTDAEPYGWIVKKKGAAHKGTFFAQEPLFDPGRWDREDYDVFPVYDKPPTDAEPVKTAPAVAVKALEWQKDAGKPDDLYVVAKSIVGSYRISPIGREGFELRLLFADPFPIYASIAEAKAAAQADYEARIRSALSAQVQDVAVPALKIGIYGKAYDRPDERRAYTYDEQPHNVEAYKLGRVCSEIHSGGDWIDRGLNLLKALQREGFGVFELPASPASKHGDAE